jgi:hypothetical protein
MKWTPGGPSQDVEDRRSEGGGRQKTEHERGAEAHEPSSRWGLDGNKGRCERKGEQGRRRLRLRLRSRSVVT